MAKDKIKKPFYKKWWVWVIAVIIVFAIAGGGGDDTDSAKEVEKNSDSAATKAEAKAEETVTKIGDTLKVGDVEFTVNGKETATNVGGQYGSNSQGTYLILDVTVKNVGNEAITTDTSFFKLKNGEKTYEADSTASMHTDLELKFFLQQVNPDLSNTGKVVFDVSDEVINSTELQLQVQTGIFGTETGIISLQ